MHAYLIIAHEQFDLLESLLKCIDDARNDIYIHIDSRSELDIGRIEKVLRNSRVEFVPRIHIRWGGFDLVRCEYMLLEAAFENGREYEYVHLISGADLPLKNQDEIHRYFDAHKGEEFVHFGAPEPTEKELQRVRYYHFASGRRNLFNRFITKAETVIGRMLGINRIKGKKIQRGSQWFSVTGEFAKYLISQKAFVFKQFKHTFIPDEFFVQTVMINSDFAKNLHSKKFDNDHRACMRCIDWTRGHPFVFTSGDYDELMNSGCLFARKFSISQDDKIVKKITSTVLNG